MRPGAAGRILRRIGVALTLGALVACGLKGAPRAPEPDETRSAEAR